MHKDLAREYFEMQLREMDADNRYLVTRVSDFEAVVRIQAGRYLPVFRVRAENFDLEAPLIEFADPLTGQRLDDSKWPSGPGVASGNTLFPGKLICRPGNIAYHTHQSHLLSPFDKLRNHFSLKMFFDRMITKFEGGQYNVDATGGIYGNA